MFKISTTNGIIEVNKNKNKFAIGINYQDNNNNIKHITLCYLKNFPFLNGNIDLDKLKTIFELWFSLINDSFLEKKDFVNYKIKKLNDLVFGDESEYFLSCTSIWFKPINNYSLDVLITAFNTLIKEKNILNDNTIIEFPHTNQKIHAHSDFTFKVDEESKNIIPDNIDLTNINII